MPQLQSQPRKQESAQSIIDSLKKPAQEGNVPSVELRIRKLERLAKEGGITLTKEQKTEIAAARKEAMINGIDVDLKKIAKYAEDGETQVVDILTANIQNYAIKAPRALSKIDKDSIDNAFLTSRAKALHKSAAKGDVERNDRLVEEIKKFSEEKQKPLNEELIAKSYIESRIKAIDKNFKDLKISADRGNVRHTDMLIEQINQFSKEAKQPLNDNQKQLINQSYNKARIVGIENELQNAEKLIEKGKAPYAKTYLNIVMEYAKEAKFKFSNEQLERIINIQKSIDDSNPKLPKPIEKTIKV